MGGENEIENEGMRRTGRKEKKERNHVPCWMKRKGGGEENENGNEGIRRTGRKEKKERNHDVAFGRHSPKCDVSEPDFPSCLFSSPE